MVKTEKPGDLYRRLKNELAAVTLSHEFEAKQILRTVLNLTTSDIVLNNPLNITENQQNAIEILLKKRLAHEPLQYLLGKWEFFGRDFYVGQGVLIPRADTEILVETALSHVKGKENPRILDLCSGSGCIGVTMALERPDATVFAVEKSPEAFAFLEKNNVSLKAGAVCILGDALDPQIVTGDFDCILSNPPYLTARDMRELDEEVRFEPEMALYGEEDGLFFYRELTKIYHSRVKPGGLLGFEIGLGQEEDVCNILLNFHENRGFQRNNVCQIKDYNGIMRVIAASFP